MVTTKTLKTCRNSVSRSSATTITISGKKKSQLLIITPVVSIDRAHYQNIDDENKNNSDVNQQFFTNSNNEQLTKSSTIGHWCSIICTAVKCFRNRSNQCYHNKNHKSNQNSSLFNHKYLDYSSSYNLCDNRQLNKSNNNNLNITYKL